VAGSRPVDDPANRRSGRRNGVAGELRRHRLEVRRHGTTAGAVGPCPVRAGGPSVDRRGGRRRPATTDS